MCLSVAASFVGSASPGAVGVLTLTKVKHRRELLFAVLPILFAAHQFIEGLDIYSVARTVFESVRKRTVLRLPLF
jgi:hypothetical protein